MTLAVIGVETSGRRSGALTIGLHDGGRCGVVPVQMPRPQSENGARFQALTGPWSEARPRSEDFQLDLDPRLGLGSRTGQGLGP